MDGADEVMRRIKVKVEEVTEEILGGVKTRKSTPK
jgi:hypothetical protein